MRAASVALLSVLIALSSQASAQTSGPAVPRLRQDIAGLPPQGAAAGQAKPDARTISVNGYGNIRTKPDLMTIAFSVESEAPTAEACSALQTGKLNKAVSALKAKLGNRGDIETSNYSVNPRMVRDTSPQTSQPPPTTWAFNESIRATAESISELTPLIDVALAAAPNVQVTGSGYEQPYPPPWAVAVATQARVVGAARVPRKNKTGAKPRPFIIFRVDSSGATAEEATKLGTQEAKKVEEALAGKLGKHGEITVTPDGFWIQQQQTYSPPRQPFREKQIYTAQTTLTVKTEQFDSLGELVSTGLANGASQVYSATFTLRDDHAARREAIAVAAKDAQSTAQSIANSMGVKLGPLLSVSTNVGVQPVVLNGIGMMRNFEGAQRATAAQAVMPVMPRKLGVNAQVTAVYRID